VNKIIVKDFWAKYSRDAIYFSKDSILPIKLNLSMFFDAYFGRLTDHDFVTISRNAVLLECRNCIHISKPRLDVCSAHIGIIEGQIELLLSSCVDLKNSINENLCTIRNT